MLYRKYDSNEKIYTGRPAFMFQVIMFIVSILCGLMAGFGVLLATVLIGVKLPFMLIALISCSFFIVLGMHELNKPYVVGSRKK